MGAPIATVITSFNIRKTPGLRSYTKEDMINGGMHVRPSRILGKGKWLARRGGDPVEDETVPLGYLILFKKGLGFLAPGKMRLTAPELFNMFVEQAASRIEDHLPFSGFLIPTITATAVTTAIEEANRLSKFTKELKAAIENPGSFYISYTDLVGAEIKVIKGWFKKTKYAILSAESPRGLEKYCLFHQDDNFPEAVMTFRFALECQEMLRKQMIEVSGCQELARNTFAEVTEKFRDKPFNEADLQPYSEALNTAMIGGLRARGKDVFDVAQTTVAALQHFKGLGFADDLFKAEPDAVINAISAIDKGWA